MPARETRCPGPRPVTRLRASVFLALAVLAAGDTAYAQGGLARANVAITPGDALDASTYKLDSFRIRNDSAGAVRIEEVSIDLSTAMLPDMVYDPVGQAGDVVAKCLEPNSGAVATGYVEPVDPCTAPFSSPHDDGFDVVAMSFTDFDPGEAFTFAADVDPTSIRAATGSGAAGSVSGLELSGATATVRFDDGSVISGRIFREPQSNGGGLSTIEAGAAPAPVLDALGIGEPASTDEAAQTIRVTGVPGASVRLVQVEAGLVLESAGGFDLDPYEANEALRVAELDATIGPGGVADVAVTLTRAASVAGLNYFIAAAVDEANARTGITSNVVVLELGHVCSCGAPVSHGATPTVSDALFVLRTAVGLADCDACECEVSGDGHITVRDALLVLRAAVGAGGELSCQQGASAPG